MSFNYLYKNKNITKLTLKIHYRISNIKLNPYPYSEYQKKLIDKSLLSKTEINQINKYHKLVNEKIKPFLTKRDGNLVNFLNRKTSIL